MLDMKDYLKYTIIATQSVREVARDYPHSKVILLADRDKDGWYVVAIMERRY